MITSIKSDFFVCLFMILCLQCPYTWSLSSRCRNAIASHASGNPRKTMRDPPPEVHCLRGHDLARASFCAACDQYISRQKWREKKAVTLLKNDSVPFLAHLTSVFTDFDLEHPLLATSLCSACVAALNPSHKNRGGKVLHFDAHIATTAQRTANHAPRRSAPCQRAPPQQCLLCERYATYSSKTLGYRRPLKRKVDAAFAEDTRQGRPKGKKHSSVRHNADGGGGRPKSLPTVEEAGLVDEQYYEFKLQTQLKLTESVVTGASKRASQRFVKELRKEVAGSPHINVEKNIRDAQDDRTNVFKDIFHGVLSSCRVCCNHTVFCVISSPSFS